MTYGSQEAIPDAAAYQPTIGRSWSPSPGLSKSKMASVSGKDPRYYFQVNNRMNNIKQWFLPIEGIEVWLGALPQRVFSGVVLGLCHGPVDSTVEVGEKGFIDTLARYANRTQFLCPGAHCC